MDSLLLNIGLTEGLCVTNLLTVTASTYIVNEIYLQIGEFAAVVYFLRIQMPYQRLNKLGKIRKL